MSTPFEVNRPGYVTPPPPKKKAWWKQPLVWVPAVALICGVGIGTGAQPEPKTIEVTKEVPGPERVVNKEVEVPVEVTPAACLEYIKLSEQAFDYSAEAMGYMSDALTAASSFNVAGIESASASLQSVNPKLTALTPQVNASKAECQTK